MKQKNDSLFLYFCASISVFVFFSALYRAATTGITVDEAYTYLWYVWNFNLKSLPDMYFSSYANNHWLNTALIWLTQQITQKEFDELTIRIPNLLFYIGYLYLSCMIAKDKQERYFIFAGLVFNYYLHEFFGLGRGYGMAAALTLAGLYFLDLWRQSGAERSPWTVIISLTFFTLAVYANTIVLLVLAAVGLSIFIYLVCSKELKTYLSPKYLLTLVFLGAANLLMVFYYFNVTEAGKPIPIYEVKMGFYESVALGYVNMFVSSNRLAANLTGALLCIFFLLTLSVWRKKIAERHFILAFALHLLLIVIAAKLANADYPSERVLLPSFPLVVMALSDCLALWREFTEASFPRAKYPYYAFANVAFAALLLLLFVRKYDLTATQEWRDNYRMRDVAYQTLALRRKTDITAFEPWTAQLQFYSLKLKKLYGMDIRDYP